MNADDDIDPAALRRAFAGPDFDPGRVRRSHLVVIDGVPYELRDLDDRSEEAPEEEEWKP